jgi:hypothetical protein
MLAHCALLSIPSVKIYREAKQSAQAADQVEIGYQQQQHPTTTLLPPYPTQSFGSLVLSRSLALDGSDCALKTSTARESFAVPFLLAKAEIILKCLFLAQIAGASD